MERKKIKVFTRSPRSPLLIPADYFIVAECGALQLFQYGVNDKVPMLVFAVAAGEWEHCYVDGLGEQPQK
jgi:hypothetical protein